MSGLIFKKRSLGILAIWGIVCLAGCQAETPHQTEVFIMDTYVTQQVYGAKKKEAADAVNTLLQSLERQLSLYKSGSDVDRINKNSGKSFVKVEHYTFELIKTAKAYSQLSDGAFDITIAPLTTLWNIGDEETKVPDQSKIEQALKCIDYTKILLNEEENSVKLEEAGMALDLGGVAKGYLADQIGNTYKEYSITSALVSIGGNICVYGTKPDRTQFTIGIRDPEDETGNGILGKISLEDRVAATSGAYERYFEQDGIRYHHILSTKTGYPAETDLLSVTVICRDGGLADFLSTTIFMAGTEKLAGFLESDQYALIAVDREHKVYLSNSIQDAFTLTNEVYTLK